MRTKPDSYALTQQSPLLFVWIILVVASAAFSFYRISNGAVFESNIRALLPADYAPAVNATLKQKLSSGAERSFVVLIQGNNKEKGLLLAKSLVGYLERSPQIIISKQEQSIIQRLKQFYFPYRYQLLADSTRHWLQSDDASMIANRLIEQLYSPVQSLRPYSFSDDPFNLAGTWMQAIFLKDKAFSTTEIPAIIKGNNAWYIVKGEVMGSPFDLSVQQSLTAAFALFNDEQANNSVSLWKSGLVFHATEGARIARAEISVVGLGSLLGIILLTTAVFRSLRPLFAIVLVLTISTLVALATSLLFFERVHLVTLAFGATLLGLAVDYIFHFLLKFSSTKNGRTALSLLLKGLLISTVSSVIAYLLQLLSPFPGLRQFAVFVASGLTTACFSVIVLGRYYKDPNSHRVLLCLNAYPNVIAPIYQKLATFPKTIDFFMLCFLVTGMLYLNDKGNQDDIRLLNTSSDSLLESEQQVRQILGHIEGQRYFLVNGDSEQALIETIEQLLGVIHLPVKAGQLPEVHAVTDLTPSLKTQRRNYQLVRDKLYGPQGALVQLCAKLEIDCETFAQPPAELKTSLIPRNLPVFLNQIMPTHLLMSEHQAIVTTKQTSQEQLQSLKSVAEKLDNVEFIDQVEQISKILSEYRQHVAGLLVLFLLCLIVICIALFRQRGMTVIISLLISMLAALVFSAHQGISLFHVLALLLVMGITIDMAVFYIQPGLDADTWTAASLSCCTSLLAFGLLSYSQVPVLQQFGNVVMAGLLCSWLLTPLLFFLTQKNGDFSLPDKLTE